MGALTYIAIPFDILMIISDYYLLDKIVFYQLINTDSNDVSNHLTIGHFQNWNSIATHRELYIARLTSINKHTLKYIGSGLNVFSLVKCDFSCAAM